MTFSRPWLLLLLAIPILLAVWECLRRGHPLVMPFDHARPRKGNVLGRFIIAVNLIPAFLLVVVILLLSGARRLQPPREERIMQNIEIVLDVSGSMIATFGQGTRYDAAMEAVTEFTNYRKDDAFGLTVFGNEVLHWVPLTRDLGAIRLATPFLRPEKMPDYFGGTQIGKALRACVKLLTARPEGDRMIILVSDGDSADLGSNITNSLAQDLRAENISVFVIKVSEEQRDVDDMYTLASMTGGSVFEAGNPTALKEVFRKIDQMKPAKLKPSESLYADFFWPLAIAGLALIGLQVMSLFGLRYTPW
jgi:Ca-activated chloride channel homolog